MDDVVVCRARLERNEASEGQFAEMNDRFVICQRWWWHLLVIASSNVHSYRDICKALILFLNARK